MLFSIEDRVWIVTEMNSMKVIAKGHVTEIRITSSGNFITVTYLDNYGDENKATFEEGCVFNSFYDARNYILNEIDIDVADLIGKKEFLEVLKDDGSNITTLWY